MQIGDCGLRIARLWMDEMSAVSLQQSVGYSFHDPRNDMTFHSTALSMEPRLCDPALRGRIGYGGGQPAASPVKARALPPAILCKPFGFYYRLPVPLVHRCERSRDRLLFWLWPCHCKLWSAV